MQYFIGLDLGSSSTKGIICNTRGESIAFASRSHGDTSLYTGWQEQDAELTWYRESVQIVQALLRSSSVPVDRIVRIGITGCVPAMILIDTQGKLLRPAILHTDVRAQEELDSMRSLGLDVHHGHLLPKLLWVKNHEKQIFKMIHAVLLPHTFMVYRLTGNIFCDSDSAAIHGDIFQEQKHIWNRELLEKISIPHEIFPQIISSTTIAGNLLPGVAHEFGLSEQTQVVVGTGDSFATLLGTGICEPREVMFYWGTSGTRVYTEESPASYIEGPHFSARKARFVGKFFSCGESLHHMQRLLGGKSFAILDKEAEALKDSTNLWYIPQKKQQLLVSGQAQASHIIGLQPMHSAAHIYRAVLEGIAFASMETFYDMPTRIDHIHLCGGGARSVLTRTIVATLAPCPVWYDPQSEAAKGIALLACLAAKDPSEHYLTLRLWRDSSNRKRVEPKDSIADIYREKLMIFTNISQGIDTIDGRFSYNRKQGGEKCVLPHR